jgi:hypothetical protein
MNNNYKKIFLTLTFALSAVAAQGASVSSKASVWYDLVRNTGTPVDYNGGSITRAQAGIINADTVTFWASGEPNDSSSEDCATQVANGSWNDLGCEQSRRVACFNGTNWTISSASVAMGADNNAAENISNAQNACPANTYFSAPVTLAQRNALSSAISAANVTNGVWINAQDMKTENVWAINKNSSAIAPFWGAGEPSGAASDCAVIDGAGNWSVSDCSASYAVACTDGTLDNWQIVNSPVAFTSIEKLTQVCQQSFGVFYQFAAPRTSSDNTALSNALSSAGISSAWINARDNGIEGYWMLNHGLFDWAAGQPDASAGICTQIQKSDGKWITVDCDNRGKLLCSDGKNWIIRSVEHQFSNQALEACSRGDGYQSYFLAAPRTEHERSLVSRLNSARPSSDTGPLWLNLKYIQDSSFWLWNDRYESPNVSGGDLASVVWYDLIEEDTNLVGQPDDSPYSSWQRYSDNVTIYMDEASRANRAAKAYFSPREPNDSGDCVQLYSSNARWDDDDCYISKRVACFNGYDWAISSASIGLEMENAQGTLNEYQLVDTANAACSTIPDANGSVGNYRFAAPMSYAQTQDLRTVAANAGAGDVWINMNDRRREKAFILNIGVDVLAPFWNAGEPNNAGAGENCAVQQTSGLWNDLSCSSVLPLACFNPEGSANGSWNITSTSYAFSTPEAMSVICEQTFGGPYKFYAPVTLSQKNDLISAMTSAGVNNVYINASDLQSEGTWLLNQDINNWDSGQPTLNTSERCVSASAESSRWSARDCSIALPVACTSGGRWYFTDETVTLNDFSNGQKACSELAKGYLFIAPRSLDESALLQYYAKLEGYGGDFWINGNRLSSFSKWEWNKPSTILPIWSGSEPNGGVKANCATLSSTDASWSDEYCDTASDFKYLCRNGDNWAISAVSGDLHDFSLAFSACSALGAGWYFAAPTTYNENILAKNAMGAEAQVWMNATDAMREGSWVLNAAAIDQYPNWASGEPDNGGIDAVSETAMIKGEDCVYQSDSGYWSDTSCSGANEYPWACTDGYIWKVTKGQGRIQNLADGHKQCFKEYGAAFVFASPLNKNDAIQIDFARLQAEKERLSAISRVWLNMTDGGDEDVGAAGTGSLFRKNLPFVNWLNPYPGEEPQNVCVYKSTVSAGQNNPWYTANCTANAAHYACFDGASWKIATSKGALVNGSLQVVPQVGEDYWSYERGDRMCKDQFGQQYYFSAPVTAAEELALDATIRSTNAQVKSTWLNYYYVNNITSKNNRWFANRLKLGVWQKPVFDNYNNSDCAVVDGSGNWTDVPCSEAHPYACFDGNWTVTGLSGQWSEGFSACDNSLAGRVFAVPRTPDEMNALINQISGGEKVWVNLSDTGLESQWISNRLRYAWWAENEPSNTGNRDCARINSTGEWYAAKCFTETAPFACRKVNGANIEWYLTTEEGIWSHGFSACALEYPGSEFISPNGYGNHSATMDQNTLQAIVIAANKDVWLNLSDQEVEGSWRPYQVYGDWAVSSLLDQNNDCGYFDRVTTGSGTWHSDSCKYLSGTPVSRGFSCTNGYEWRVVNSAPTTDLRWSEGFTACQAQGTDWNFAAPTNAVDNAKLKLALELAGLEQVWINAHDRIEEGEWQINGAETNFAVSIDLTQTAQLVNEQVNNIQLHALLADDEEVGVASASWELISNTDFDNPASTHNDITVGSSVVTLGANGTATVVANYSTPALLQKDRILTFKVTATDIPPGTASPSVAEAFVNVRVKAPILAHYDFSNSSQPQNDISGNDHHALNTVAYPMPDVVNGALILENTRSMVIPGLAADSVNGLVLPEDAYTVAFRISVESAVAGGILQKGDGDLERQPALFMYPDAASLHATNSTSADNNRAANVADIPFQQWLNLIYVKDATGFRVYIDEELAASYTYTGGETAVANTGNLYVGKVPGHASSFFGLLDDLQVFNRALNATERANILPAPPMGQVQFVDAGTITDEFTTIPGNTVTIALERTRGSKEPLTVYVDVDSTNSTATRGTQADMITAVNAADFAFPASYIQGTGLAVSWPANTRGQQSFVITLDNDDDNLREGTEIARLKISDTGSANTGTPANFALRLTDLTPNPYGNFSLVGPDPQVVLENNNAVQSFCIRRESGSDGEVTVSYEISGDAIAGVDYQYVAGDITPAGSSGNVIFADGDGADKCINLQVAVNPEVGTADKSLSVALTGLTYTAPTDPILTAQNNAVLIIRDYAPGDFSFAASSFSCKEPNTGVTVPDELKPSTAELACEVIVTRTNTSIYAPAAAINVIASPVSPSDYSFTTQLNWPAITPAEPANATTENQSITFAIVNDDVQENDEVASLSLTPVNAENIVVGNATLTIVDVTSPAVLTIAGNSMDTYEGQLLTVTINRDGNPKTAFSSIRSVEVKDKLAGKTDDDYLSFDYSTPVGASSTLTYGNESAVPTMNQLLIRTKDIMFNGTSDYVVRVMLGNPSPERVIGLGTIDNANKDISVNQTYRDFVIKNDVSVNDLIVLDQVGLNNNSTSVSGVYYPIDNFLGNVGRVQLSFKIPEKSLVNKKHSWVNYSWEITDTSGIAFKTPGEATGSFQYFDSMSDADRTKTIELVLPYTYQFDISSAISLKVWGGASSALAEADEVYEALITVVTTPRWRALKWNGNCVQYDSGQSRFEAHGCTTSELELWTYDPIGKHMIYKDGNSCAGGNANIGKVSCTGALSTWNLQQDGSDRFNVRQVDDGGDEKWCRISTDNNVLDARTNTWCSGSDDLFYWGSDL